MIAVRIHQHGGPEVLSLDELVRPEGFEETEVLVEMKAAALNHLDLWVRKGLPGISLPIIMGSDGAGIVAEVGSKVTEFKPGDEVVVQPGTFCGKCAACQAGQENLCAAYGILGESQDGVQASQVVLKTDNLAKKLERLSFPETASFGLVFLTAYQMLVKRAQLKAGETVLVVGGNSGVGAAAIQIAVGLGARVIATAGEGEKTEFVRAMGAHEVVDHYQPEWYKEVLAAAGAERVQVVFEHVGTATWEQSVRTMGLGARLVFCGATTGSKAMIDLRHAFRKQLSFMGSTMGDRGTFQSVIEGFRSGIYRPIVDREFPIEEAAEAHRYLESGRHRGKVVLNFP
ncbi:alcohol dehydrogenase catalytic domain-containing protein [Candidatus Neomarinimicrobiota bacterium]